MNDQTYQPDRDDVDPGGEVHATGDSRAGDRRCEEAPQIVATRVPDDKRLGFLPEQTVGQNLAFEFGVYDMARELSTQYGGGFWEFYILSNGGFYIAQEGDEKLHVLVGTNGYEGDLSPDAFGIVCTLFSLNKMLWQNPTEHLNTKYYALYDYAAQHPEASAIFGAID